MTLRNRLTLAIVGLVFFTVVVVWVVSSGIVLRPFAAGVFDNFLNTAVHVAKRVEAGDDPKELSQDLGITVQWAGHNRRGKNRRAKHRKRRRDRGERTRGELPNHVAQDMETRVHRGYTIGFPPGRRNRLVIETSRGWLVLKRDLDLSHPRRQLAIFLPLIALLIAGFASLLAAYSTRPLTATQEGMKRIAEGDLEHRIPEEGPAELIAVAKAFNAMANRIDSLLRTERELLAGISHELRTPLTRLRLELELLRDGGAPPKRIDAMEGDVTELDTLISELLSLSRMQLGDAVVNTQELDLYELVESAVSAVDLPNTSVIIEGPGGTSSGDQVLWHRALCNLLQNAHRYGGDQVRIHVEPGRIVVEDNGPGVEPAALPHLFDPFFREEKSRSKNTGGMGLGLMIVRQVTELHQGKVHAERSSLGGLRVVMTLN